METFVVRVWRAADQDLNPPEERLVPLRGFVEHVPSGAVVPFRGSDELVRFLRAPAGPDDPVRSGNSDMAARPVRESQGDES
ncbi:MAG: hypothetical protein ACREK5_02835 [Gemmatimonadota bacterium]